MQIDDLRSDQLDVLLVGPVRDSGRVLDEDHEPWLALQLGDHADRSDWSGAPLDDFDLVADLNACGPCLGSLYLLLNWSGSLLRRRLDVIHQKLAVDKIQLML